MRQKIHMILFYIFFIIQISFSLAGSVAWILMKGEAQWVPYTIMFSTIIWITLAATAYDED